MFKFIREFIECMNVSEAETLRRAEQRFPGATERYAALKADQAERTRRIHASIGVPSEYQKNWGGSFTNVSNPAVAAHLNAMNGSLNPKVAFSLGAPGAPDGTGKLVGLNGHYRG